MDETLKREIKNLIENMLLKCYNYVIWRAFIMWNKLIKEIRGELLITQKELAGLLDVSFATVNRWENNKFEPSIREKRKIKKLCEEHNIEIGGNNNG